MRLLRGIPFPTSEGWLPSDYHNQLGRERDELAQLIHDRLDRYLRSEGEGQEVIKLLERFRRFLFDFTREEKIHLINQLLLAAFHCPTLDYVLQQQFCFAVVRLLRSEKKIPGLLIEWRPLYHMVKRLYFTKQRKCCHVPLLNSHSVDLIDVLRFASPYFPENATEDILREFRPLLCPHDQMVFQGMGFLLLLLPVCNYKNSDEHYGNHQMDSYPWLEEMIKCGDLMDSFMWNAGLFHFLARTAHRGKTIDWNPLIPLLFSKMQRLIANGKHPLPVGTSTLPIPPSSAMDPSNNILFAHAKSLEANMSRLIGAMLSPHSCCQDYLSKMLGYLEPYFHPSNYGAWSRSLGRFLHSLSAYVSSRVVKERKHEEDWNSRPVASAEERQSSPPEHFRFHLSRECIDNFVKSLLPIATKALYSKSVELQSCAEVALKNLGLLSPSLVFPDLLDLIVQDLQSFEQTHRTQAALQLLGAIGRPLLWREHYPEGGRHLSNLLCLSLPGIDPNDTMKSMYTIQFYRTVLVNVPLFDCSSVENEGENELDREIRVSTEYLPDWAIEVLEKTLTLFSCSVSDVGEFTLERASHFFIESMIGHLFQQASPPLYERLLQRLFDFVTTTTLSSAVEPMGVLCRLAVVPSPDKALSLFINHYHAHLLPGDADGKIDHFSESEMEWILTILCQIATQMGDHLLAFREPLEEIITASLRFCEEKKKLYRLTCSLIKEILLSLTTVYCTDSRSLSRSVWDTEDLQQNVFHYWGVSGDVDHLLVEWHHPSSAGMQWATDLLEQFAYPGLQKLEECVDSLEDQMSDSKTISSSARQQLTNSLILISLCVEGSVEALSTPLVHPDHQGETVTAAPGEWTPSVLGKMVTYSIDELQSAFNLNSIGKVLLRLTSVMEDSSDTDSLILIATTISRCLIPFPTRGRGSGKVSRQLYKMMDLSCLSGKKALRYFMVEQAKLLFESRLNEQNSMLQWTPMRRDLFFHLLRFSFNSYSKVSAVAQNLFSLVTKCLSISCRLYGSTLLTSLDPEQPHYHISGALSLFSTMSLLEEVFIRWPLFRELLQRLVTCMHHERPSVQNNLSRVLGAIKNTFFTAPIEYLPFPDYPPSPATQERLTALLEENKKAYYGIMHDISQMKVPWKYMMGMGGVVNLLLREDHLPSPEITQWYVSLLSSDVVNLRHLSGSGMKTLLLYFKPVVPRTYVTNTTDEQSAIGGPIQRISVPEYAALVNESSSSAPPKGKPMESNLPEKNFSGWNQIVRQQKAYVPITSEEYERIRQEAASHPSIQVIQRALYDPDQLKLIISRLALEPNKIGFTPFIAMLFKGFFQLFGCSLFRLLREPLHALVHDDADQPSHTLACHIVAGLVRGSKHWPTEQLDEMWEYLVPYLNAAIENTTSENVPNWIATINFCVYDRSPQRLRPLLETFLSSTQLESNCTAVVQSRKLQALSTILQELSWRSKAYADPVLLQLQKHICSDRKLIRNSVESLAAVLLASFDDGCRDAKTHQLAFQGERYVDETGQQYVQALMEEYQRTDVTQTNGSIDPAARQQLHAAHINCCKSIMSLVTSSFHCNPPGVALPYLIPLLPHLLSIRDEDPDIMAILFTAIGYVANANLDAPIAEEILEICYDLLQTSTWHTRVTILPFIQVLIFKNIFILGSQIPRVIESHVIALNDTQLEVRDLASTSLAGILKFVESPQTILDLRDKFLALADTPCPTNRTDSSFLTRHAGVLGLAALVRVYPYDIPEWLPEVLIALAGHIHDPVPIRDTVKKTFLEFWRVHQDAWVTEKNSFTSSQLAVLTELVVAPSYFS